MPNQTHKAIGNRQWAFCMSDHRQTLSTTSTKQRRQVANQFNARLAARDQRRAHRQALRRGITTGMGTNFVPIRGAPPFFPVGASVICFYGRS